MFLNGVVLISECADRVFCEDEIPVDWCNVTTHGDTLIVPSFGREKESKVSSVLQNAK